MANSAAKWCQKGARRTATPSKCIKKCAPGTKMGGSASRAPPIFDLLAHFLMHLDGVAPLLAPFWHHLAAELAI